MTKNNTLVTKKIVRMKWSILFLKYLDESQEKAWPKSIIIMLEWMKKDIALKKTLGDLLLLKKEIRKIESAKPCLIEKMYALRVNGNKRIKIMTKGNGEFKFL